VGGRTASEAAFPRGETRLTSRAFGLAAIAAYLLTIAAFEIARRTSGFPEPSDFALTPARLADLRVWLLLTSALLVSGPPLLELAGLGLAIAVLVNREGALSFWGAGLVGHVGATLLAYAGVGVLWLTARHTVSATVHDFDYGVSAIWLATLGAVFASVWRERSQPLQAGVLAICAGAAVIGTVFFEPLAAAEHLLAFMIGAGVQSVSATHPVMAKHA
jgi:hypothetical protein